MGNKKLMVHDFIRMKQEGKKITWVTSYDFPTAQFAEAAGMDMILVGDSLGMCVYGYESTVPVTMDQCIVHCEAVRRGAPNTFVVGDMPLGSYQASDEDAVQNAIRFVKEAGVDAIKLEGGKRVISRIKAILEARLGAIRHREEQRNQPNSSLKMPLQLKSQGPRCSLLKQSHQRFQALSQRN